MSDRKTILSNEQQSRLTSPARTWYRCLLTGISFYYLTTLVVFAGVWWGADFLGRRGIPYVAASGVLGSLGNRDGVSYATIAREGYTYDRQHRSSAAYFPGYPLLGRALSKVAGLTVEQSLLLVSHLSLVGAFVLMAAYVRQRYPDAPAELRDWTLLAMGLWPTTLFFRMAYSESLFLVVALGAMLAMHRSGSLWVAALLVGLATACRPVGMALLLPFAWHVWKSSKTTTGFLLRGVVLAPVSSWGILIYMAYQHAAFGDALAFLKAQDHFAGQILSQREQILGALTLEPIWSKYDPSSPAYWARGGDVDNPLFSMEFANPIYFLATASLVTFGAWKGWLDEREWLLALGLLLIPYLGHSYRTNMLSQGRYAASVFPFYLVLGRILWRLPAPLSAALCGWSAFMLGAYSALFAASHRII